AEGLDQDLPGLPQRVRMRYQHAQVDVHRRSAPGLQLELAEPDAADFEDRARKGIRLDHAPLLTCSLSCPWPGSPCRIETSGELVVEGPTLLEDRLAAFSPALQPRSGAQHLAGLVQDRVRADARVQEQDGEGEPDDGAVVRLFRRLAPVPKHLCRRAPGVE